MKRLLFTLLAASFVLSALPAQTQKPKYPPEIPGSRTEVYRSIGAVDLKAWIFEPTGHSASDPAPAIVFFFGGGWNGGTPGQFRPQAEYLAKRGMVAIAVDYRVRSRQGTLANVAVSDAKAALRWVRLNSARLGVNPDRIAAAGGSAGGHLAAATAILPGHDDANEYPDISPVPDALVLFNPALITAPIPGMTDQGMEKFKRLETRLGADAQSMSPYHHVRAGLPPTIIFHGEEDKTVPFATVELFTEAMKSAGNDCELVAYPGEGHGFFNANRVKSSAHLDTTARMDEFLVTLGWLEKRQ